MLASLTMDSNDAAVINEGTPTRKAHLPASFSVMGMASPLSVTRSSTGIVGVAGISRRNRDVSWINERNRVVKRLIIPNTMNANTVLTQRDDVMEMELEKKMPTLLLLPVHCKSWRMAEITGPQRALRRRSTRMPSHLAGSSLY